MPAPHMPPAEFRRLGHELIDFIADYISTVGERRVTPTTAPGDLFHALPADPPEHAESWNNVLRDFQSLVMPAVTHWQSPDFHAFFPANASEPAILGELLSAGLGINGFLWQCSPAITELEMRMMDWLGRAITLPDDFLFEPRTAAPGNESRGLPAYARAPGGGVIHGTASEAVLTALVAARHRAQLALPLGEGAASSRRERGTVDQRFTLYTSSQAHSSVTKAAMIAGLGRDAVRLIDVDRSLAMRPDALGDAITRDRAAGLAPCFICATVGTTSTGAIDPLQPIGEIARREHLWLHVDAAYAGAACICSEHRPIIDGVELADSFNFNPHKWLLTNFDCSAFWTRDRAALTNSLNITPAYLRNAASDAGLTIDYRDWQIPLGRRFRALKLWFVMRHYGLAGLREHIRHHIRLAELFESFVRVDDRFELPTPRCLSLVCFRLKGSDEANRALVDRLNATGRIFLTPTVVSIGPAGEPRTVIRMAIGSPRTEERHIRAAWDLIRANNPPARTGRGS